MNDDVKAVSFSYQILVFSVETSIVIKEAVLICAFLAFKEDGEFDVL